MTLGFRHISSLLEDQEIYIKAGADQVLVKPLTQKTLNRMVMLAKKQMRQGEQAEEKCPVQDKQE